MSVWIVIPVVFGAFFLLVWALSRIVHNNPEIESQMRREAGDRPVTPIPDGDEHHHHFH